MSNANTTSNESNLLEMMPTSHRPPAVANEPAWYTEPPGTPENPHQEPASGQNEAITQEPKPSFEAEVAAMPKTPAPQPLPTESEALATILGARSAEVDIRGFTVKVRELEIADLLPLFNWIDGIKDDAKLFAGGKLTEQQKGELVKQAALKGVDLISICTDGAIPKGKTLPLGVTTKLISAIIEVNTDFFEELPTLISLGTEFRALLPAANGASAAPSQ